jgi:hypothetical protein
MVTKKSSKKKKNGFWSKVGKMTLKGAKVAVAGGKKTLDVFDKIAIGAEKANSGKMLGEVVTINNGSYKGEKMIISAFIPGGIQGRLVGSGILVNIRHGGYN